MNVRLIAFTYNLLVKVLPFTERRFILITAVTNAIADVLGWIGAVITSLTSTTGELYALLPLFAIGVAIKRTTTANKIKTVSDTEATPKHVKA